MAITIQNVTRQVPISNGNFNMPSTKGIDTVGDWFVYLPVNANNDTLGASLEPFRWSDRLPIANNANTIAMDGTMALITEPFNGTNVSYHGSSIEHIGSGVNDITNAAEDDAYFFSHLGSLSPATDDNAFYWDRLYLGDTASTWDYYQYHKHLPTSYQTYENGRMTHSAGSYINPEDKAYGYTINTRVKVGNAFYQSVLARIHTPSVGGAHNSHNDVTLPSSSTKDYMQGGILKGSGNRFHAFYIAANGADWDLFVRTYIQTSASFTAEVNLGSYDFADPTIDTTSLTGQCHFYPVRASAGDLLGTRIYFPVIMNASGSKFDLEVWSFNSLDTIAGGTLVRETLASSMNSRPDCQMLTVGDKLYALFANTSNNTVQFREYANSAWDSTSYTIVTNGTTTNNNIRVHGFKYNTEDSKFYALLSGNSSGTGTYTGSGLYTFEIGGDFLGYKHLDFDSANNAFISRGALTNGHLIYTVSDASINRSSNVEPKGIASSDRILEYLPLTPTFFNKSDLSLGGDEYIYHGIKLKDNRKFLAGRVLGLPYGTGNTVSDLLVSIVDQDNLNTEHFAWNGLEPDSEVDINGDSYITAAYQSKVDPNKVWITGYTKSELVQKKDMKIHGWCRNLSDAPNILQFNDLVKDSNGDIYLAGTSSDGYAFLAKYNYNYVLQWQKQIGASEIVTGESIAIDSNDNLYVIGSANNDAMITKLTKDGVESWTYAYGSTETEEGKGIAVVTKAGTEYVVAAVASTSNTTFIVLNSSGNILEQNKVTNLSVNRIRKEVSTANGGFLFAGTHGASNGKFGLAVIDDAARMIQWTSTYGIDANDIANIDGGATKGYVVCGKINSSNASMLKVTVTESAGVYTVSKSWARQLSNSEYLAVTTSPYTDTTKYIYAVGRTPTGGTAAMGMDEGLVTKYSNTGTLLWQNVFGHDMDEAITGVILDSTGENLITSAWSESHSTSRDALVFRCETGGFGTGVYHLNGNTGIPYYYLKSTLVDAAENTSITNLTAPTDVAGTSTQDNGLGFTYTDAGATMKIYDGSYGRNGVFMLHFGYVTLSKLQEHLNSDEHKINNALGRLVNFTPNVFTLWQVGTVGDGSADDGNIFGYDIIEAANGDVYIIGQTSGDVQKTNQGTSGVYDYILVKFDPTTEEIEYYQNGTELDEETYALCELSGGKIAFTGRTSGALGNTNIGGYDIFLGIYNPSNDTFVYRSTGTGLDDKGVNVHDLGNNTLAIVCSTYGELQANNYYGSEDIAVILYDYANNTFGNAYQTGTASSDIFEQNGKPSVLLDDGRIAITFSTGGVYDSSGTTYGFLDMALAILDRTANTWTKAQVGSQTSDIASSIFAKGERLLICGHAADTFGSGGQGIFVEADVQLGVGGKSSS